MVVLLLLFKVYFVHLSLYWAEPVSLLEINKLIIKINHLRFELSLAQGLNKVMKIKTARMKFRKYLKFMCKKI